LATGASVTHTYGNAGAGNRSPYLDVYCRNCGAEADSAYLSVSAISGINVSQIGDVANPGANGRLCFDAVRGVVASALPAGVNGSNLIDWLLPGMPSNLVLVNSPGTAAAPATIPSPAPWSTSNSVWGPNILYCMIDSSSPSFVPSQDGELNLTGTPSYIS